MVAEIILEVTEMKKVKVVQMADIGKKIAPLM